MSKVSLPRYDITLGGFLELFRLKSDDNKWSKENRLRWYPCQRESPIATDRQDKILSEGPAFNGSNP